MEFSLISLLKTFGACLGVGLTVVLLVVFWKAFSYIWAIVSGWTALAEAYPDRRGAPAVSIKRRVMFMTKNSFKLCVNSTKIINNYLNIYNEIDYN